MGKVSVWQLMPAREYSGEVLPVQLDPAPASLDESSKMLPGGGYTTFRTFGSNRVMQFDSHFNRLEETARLAGKPVTLAADKVRAALRKAVKSFPSDEKRVRITLDLEQHMGSVYIAVEELRIPSPADYQQGVRTVTRQARRENPKAKLTNFIKTAGAIRKDLPPGVNEALMVEDGMILEGLTSNFFALIDAELWTAEEGVLSGLTRALVLEEAAAAGLVVRLSPVPVESLPRAQEAFITSASRAVLPVVQIDDLLIGGGQPGVVTLDLLARYQARIEAETEAI